MRNYIVLLLATAFGTTTYAQVRPARLTAAPHLPVLRPTIVELAQFRDTGGVPLPYEVALSPNGRLMAYFGCTSWTLDICMTIWNTVTHERHELVTGPLHVFAWGQKGDQIVFRTNPGGVLRYRGSELSRGPAIWTIRVDSVSGEAMEAPHHVADVGVNHGVFFSPDEQTIAFAQWHGWYVSSVSVVPAAGGTPRILASGVEVHTVRWSADGSALFFRAHESSTSPTASHYRVPLTGGTPVAVVQDYPAPLDKDSLWLFSDPVTRRPVAYMVMPSTVETAEWAGLEAWPGRHEMGAVRYVKPRGLRVVSLTTGSTRDLVDTTAEVIGEAEWFAGDHVAVLVRQNERTALLIERADGTDARTFPLVHTHSVNQLQISPDGRYAAFMGAAGGFGTIELVELASGRQRTLVTSADDFGSGNAPEGRGLGGLAWSQDSKKVLYIADLWTAAPVVHEVTTAGSDSMLRPLPRFIYGPGPLFFPNTAAPLFVEFAGAGNFLGGGAVTLVPIDGTLPKVVSPERSFGGPLSPDGRTLAVQIPPPNGQGPIRIKLASVDDSNARDLVLPFIALRGVKWHPDGQHLLVLGRDSAAAAVSVYSVPVNGNSPSLVARLGSTREESLSVSSDGRYVAVTISGTPSATLLKLEYNLSAISPSPATKVAVPPTTTTPR